MSSVFENNSNVACLHDASNSELGRMQHSQRLCQRRQSVPCQLGKWPSTSERRKYQRKMLAVVEKPVVWDPLDSVKNDELLIEVR